MKNRSNITNAMLSAAAISFLSGGAIAGEMSSDVSAKGAPLPPVEDPSLCDSLWDIPHLYSNPDGFWLTDFKLVGRYQLQYAHVDSDQSDYNDWESRRFRLGAEARILGGDWKVKGEINVDPDFNPFYEGLEEAYISYQPSDAFHLTIGKQKPKWSYEWGTSSRKILTFERSLLVNQLNPEKASGVSAAGKVNSWLYSVGLYSGDITDDEFGRFDAGVFTASTIGYDYGGGALDKAVVKLDWVYNADSENTAAAPYRHSLSLNHYLKKGAFGLGTDLIYADGFDDDAYGLVILPTYDITDKLQLVGRYTYAHGDNDSLRAQSRYERKVPDITDGGHGEEYHSFYAGLNYYICDHKLKLMTGVEYSDLQDKAGDGGDFEGWTWFSGVRFYF